MADSKKDEWLSSLFIGLGLAGLGIGGGLAAASATLGPPAIAIWAFVMVMVIVLMKSPLAAAVAKQIAEAGGETQELSEGMYAELDELRARVLELEERQDFSERMLASQARSSESEGD